jgi:hypothetical protein
VPGEELKYGAATERPSSDGKGSWREHLISDEAKIPISVDLPSSFAKVRQDIPMEAASPNGDRLKINVAIGNHRYPHGIGEILYTLKAFFARLSPSYDVTYSVDLKPGVTNVLIDEFSLGETVDFLREFKLAHPGTKFVIVATEFITPIRPFGLQLGETFNYFDPWEDRKYGFSMLAHGVKLARQPAYMRARYLGFSQVLRLADLVVAVHPAIVNALLPLTGEMNHWVAPPANLYPEIDLQQSALISRLQGRQAGFVTTGTQTRFRRNIIKKLLQVFDYLSVQGPIFHHLPFERSAPFALRDGRIDFPFEEHADEIGEEKRLEIVGEKTGGLFNLNPPQRANWPYSSPMRILRAVLYGQIPVITRLFGDHEIEALAKLWDPDRSDSGLTRDLWLEATLKRESLIAPHLAAISKYNEIAKQKNEVVDLAFRALEGAPPSRREANL